MNVSDKVDLSTVFDLQRPQPYLKVLQVREVEIAYL